MDSVSNTVGKYPYHFIGCPRHRSMASWSSCTGAKARRGQLHVRMRAFTGEAAWLLGSRPDPGVVSISVAICVATEGVAVGFVPCVGSFAETMGSASGILPGNEVRWGQRCSRCHRRHGETGAVAAPLSTCGCQLVAEWQTPETVTRRQHMHACPRIITQLSPCDLVLLHLLWHR